MVNTSFISTGFSASVLLWLEAIHAIELLLLVGEAYEAHGGLCFAAVLAGSGDGVPDAAVGQPTGVAAVVAVEFPRSIHVAHLGDLCIVVQACLHSLVIGQPLGLLQPIEGTWGVNTRVNGYRQVKHTQVSPKLGLYPRV